MGVLYVFALWAHFSSNLLFGWITALASLKAQSSLDCQCISALGPEENAEFLLGTGSHRCSSE